jgi:cyanophycinase
MASNENQGKLLIIGGAEDKEGDCKILREFLRCAEALKPTL